MAAAQTEIDQLRGRVDRLEREAAERASKVVTSTPTERPYSVIARMPSGPSKEYLIHASDRRAAGEGVTVTWTTNRGSATHYHNVTHDGTGSVLMTACQLLTELNYFYAVIPVGAPS